MCSAFVVPVSGSMPASRANRKMTCVTRADAVAAMPRSCRDAPARAGSPSAARNPGRRCRATGRTRAPRGPSRARRKQRFWTKLRLDARAVAQQSQLRQRHVADAERPSSGRLSCNCSIASHASPVQRAEPGVHASGRAARTSRAASTPRCSSELANDCSTCVAIGAVRIVRQPVVLPAAERELRLQEQLVPRHQPVRDRRRDRRADARLVVVLPLVRRIDRRETPAPAPAARSRSVASSFHAVPYRNAGWRDSRWSIRVHH